MYVFDISKIMLKMAAAFMAIPGGLLDTLAVTVSRWSSSMELYVRTQIKSIWFKISVYAI